MFPGLPAATMSKEDLNKNRPQNKPFLSQNLLEEQVFESWAQSSGRFTRPNEDDLESLDTVSSHESRSQPTVINKDQKYYGLATPVPQNDYSPPAYEDRTGTFSRIASLSLKTGQRKKFAVQDARRLVISLDFGTTYTGEHASFEAYPYEIEQSLGVAFAFPKSEVVDLAEIEVIKEWGREMGNQEKIPSVISYSENGEKQWGSAVEINAITRVNMKLELDLMTKRSEELLSTLQLLEGTGSLSFDNIRRPEAGLKYTSMTPFEVVRDYLTKVFQQLLHTIQKRYRDVSELPTDVVITTPVVRTLYYQ